MSEPFVHRVRPRYGEIDMQRVVFNAHYLAYCDDAVECWFRDRGLDVASFGWDFMLKKAVVEWASAATYGEELELSVRASRWGNTSFDVTIDGRTPDRDVFTCTITYVGVRHGTRETMPPPAAVRAALGG